MASQNLLELFSMVSVAAACDGHHQAVVAEMDGERLKLLPGFQVQNLP